MNRAVGVIITMVWVVAMAALIQRDVVPFWAAQEAPGHVFPDDAFQVAIHNAAGVRLGTTWVTTTPTTAVGTIRSTTYLDLRLVAGILPVQRPMLLDSTLTYQAGELSQFQFCLEGFGRAIRVVGERCGRDFACTTTLGQTTKTISLDGRLSEYLSETLRPFTHLDGLHVGQSWRIRLLDPFSVMPGIGKGQPNFKMQLVTVTRRETIEHHGRRVACFRIETDGTLAWADDTGKVLRQEVQAPLLGRWILTDESFDRVARNAAIALIRNGGPSMQASAGEAHQP